MFGEILPKKPETAGKPCLSGKIPINPSIGTIKTVTGESKIVLGDDAAVDVGGGLV